MRLLVLTTVPPGQGPLKSPALTWHVIHDDVSQTKEAFRVEWLGEEVGKVRVGMYKRHLDLHVLNTFTYEEVPAGYVFHSGMVFGVIGHRDG